MLGMSAYRAHCGDLVTLLEQGLSAMGDRIPSWLVGCPTLGNGDLSCHHTGITQSSLDSGPPRGLFAARPFHHKDLITYYGGELISNETARYVYIPHCLCLSFLALICLCSPFLSDRSRRQSRMSDVDPVGYILRISDSHVCVDGALIANEISSIPGADYSTVGGYG